MSLSTKYRPDDFECVLGQTVVVNILRSMCENRAGLSNRNFLFVGPAGCGKTTLARIVATKLNNGVRECIEIDAASNSGVDAMRDIVQQARAFPINCEYKIWIIDECHALSNQAWQSLLKVLEESPARSVFIFCTTNPEKIPSTIISRVQVFRLSKLSTDLISQRLKYVLDSEIADGEQISYQDTAIRYIAKIANGGMRDALTLLDKALAYSNTISDATIVEALDLPDYDRYFSLLSYISKRDNSGIVEEVNSVFSSGTNAVSWFDGFFAFLVNIVKYIYSQDISKTTIPDVYADKISVYTQKHANICLVLSYTVSTMLSEMRISPYQQEVVLMHLCKPTKGGD